MAQEIHIGQVYQDKDRRRIERFVKVISIGGAANVLYPEGSLTETHPGDILVRSCDFNGTFLPKTPQVFVSANRLKKRFKLVAVPATLK